MMFAVAGFVIVWTFAVSSNHSFADLSLAGCGAYFLMSDLNRYVTTADLHNDLLRLQNHTCQFVPLDWSLRQHVSQLQLGRKRRGCRAGRRARDRRRTVSTNETNDGEIPVILIDLKHTLVCRRVAVRTFVITFYEQFVVRLNLSTSALSTQIRRCLVVMSSTHEASRRITVFSYYLLN